MKGKSIFASTLLTLTLGIGVFASFAVSGKQMKQVDALTAETTNVMLDVTDNSYWKRGNERYAVYYYGGVDGTGWLDLTAVSNTYYSLYEANVPNDATIIFCRMNGAASENTWDNRWNQTENITSLGGAIFDVEDVDGRDCKGQWYLTQIGICFYLPILGLKMMPIY